MLTDILTSDVSYTTMDIINQINGIKVENRLKEEIRYIKYEDNISKLRTSILSAMRRIRASIGPTSSVNLLELFKELCLRLEAIESRYYSEDPGSTKDMVELIEQNNNLDYTSLKKTYLEALSEKFVNLTKTVQDAVRELFKLKCDVIDYFTDSIICERGMIE